MRRPGEPDRRPPNPATWIGGSANPASGILGGRVLVVAFQHFQLVYACVVSFEIISTRISPNIRWLADRVPGVRVAGCGGRAISLGQSLGVSGASLASAHHAAF